MKRSFAAGSAEEQFRRLDHAHRTTIDAMMSGVGLGNLGQPMILALLAESPEGVIDSQRELARLLHVTPATVTVSLASMERAGYLRRKPDENDLRRKRIAITEKGRDAARKIDMVIDRLDHEMYRGFDAEERTRISALFSRMIENLQSLSVSDLSQHSSKEESSHD